MPISVTSYSSNAHISAQSQNQAVVNQSDVATGSTTASTTSGSPVTVSWLAQQLSDAESRAQTRDATKDRSELAAMAKTIVAQIAGDTWDANKAINDAEVPASDDPQALALAKQATAFTSHTGNNPFKGMSTEQLDAIAYDDSGNFTVNERRAAWSEVYDQEEAWRVKTIAMGQLEYDTTGKQNNFFDACLKHYQGLPPIEQAQYPDDYAARLQHWIDLDFNFWTNRAEGSGTSHHSLIELVFGQSPYNQKSDGGPIQETATAQTADNSSASDLASAFAKKNEQTRAALDQVGQSSAESKKEYARKRLEEIEDMLRQLMMFGLSPRQLSDLMKEVKDLVQQYQTAGNALNASASTTAGGTSDVAQSSGNAGATGEAGDVSESATALGAAPSDASPETAAPAPGEPTGASVDHTLSQRSGGSSLTSTYREIADGLSSRDEAGTANVEFMTHAKSLLTQLQAMLKHADAQQTQPAAASG
jgi:hypothetical protein